MLTKLDRYMYARKEELGTENEISKSRECREQSISLLKARALVRCCVVRPLGPLAWNCITRNAYSLSNLSHKRIEKYHCSAIEHLNELMGALKKDSIHDLIGWDNRSSETARLKHPWFQYLQTP